MREFNIKYTNLSPNKIYEINGSVSVSELQILEQQIKDNEKNVCTHGRGLYTFTVVVAPYNHLMILGKGNDYVSCQNYILILRNYDPSC